ncbi:MAG: nitrogen regulatory protein PII [Arenicella sp.]|jgi:nitrogen regulatory protein PII
MENGKMKKLEVVIPNSFISEVISDFAKADIHGYTALDVDRGKGENTSENLLAGLLPVTRNTYIFAICDEKEAQVARELIEPLLEETGGILIVSDVFACNVQ